MDRSCPVQASEAMPITDDYSVASLHARSPPPAASARAARAGDDRRRRRRAPVHAVGRIAAARGARARGRRGAARAGRARGPPDRRRARAGPPRRSPARPRRARRGGARGSRRQRVGAGEDRLLPVGRVPHRRAGDAGARAGRARSALRVDRRRARAVAASARARRRGPRPGRRVAASAAGAARRRRPRGPLARPGSRDAARGPPVRAPPSSRRAAGRARRRCMGDRASRDGVGGDDREDVPRARGVRPRHPPPDERQRHQPGARGGRAGRDAAARPGGPGPGGAPGRRRSGHRRRLRAPHDLRRDPHRGRQAPLRQGAARGRARGSD